MLIHVHPRFYSPSCAISISTESATPSSPIIDDTTRHHHHHNTLSDEKIANQTDQTSHQSDDADDDAADEHTIQNSFQTGAGHPVIINDGARPENRTNDNAIDTNSSANSSAPTNSTSDMMRRVKRKSGKTTGALSRPKGASDSGSKSTSRKKDGECFLDSSLMFALVFRITYASENGLASMPRRFLHVLVWVVCKTHICVHITQTRNEF